MKIYSFSAFVEHFQSSMTSCSTYFELKDRIALVSKREKGKVSPMPKHHVRRSGNALF